ncbi:acyl-CoA dehydrogenase [Gemmatimonas groenlandica]|uniref:Acyl-CoA dehydrogenase n=1 Tax=Gemmatimonas groenlandica TaxID=2732249 RepID=A0A6M4IKP2_9BACT|nr:acyl-CoA dehydrogenase [Gemmatimonas groenlandica]QJR35210.1 acyl-CoA dehydrogenase [Gemmatimonas groenlandica]
MTTDDLASWRGRSETVHDELASAQLLAAAATFDDAILTSDRPATIPALWHWFYFLPRAPHARLSPDGHPERGGFMPPVLLPRRMFAGSRMTFHAPLRLATPARRDGVIREVTMKDGKSGPLAFVTVGYRIWQDGVLCLEEEQDIVYREQGAPVAAPVPIALPVPPAHAITRDVTPDPRLLFRFSALTFNAHRIHYDREYATRVEQYPGLVVHGPLTAVLLANLVRQHTARELATFSFRGVAPLFDLAPFRLVAIPDGDTVTCQALGPDGRIALEATATLAPA